MMQHDDGAIWEHLVPGLTSSCLLGGNSSTGLPLTTFCGLSSGKVQIWGEETRACMLEADMAQRTPGGIRNATISAVAALNVKGMFPKMAAGNAGGEVALFELTSESLNCKDVSKLHASPVTDVDMNGFGLGMASCAEQGSVVVTRNLEDLSTVEVMGETDGVCINSILFWNENSLAIAGASPGANLRIWDLRTRNTSTIRSTPGLYNFKDPGSLTCLASHPSLPYQVVAGDGFGGLNVFDFRMLRQSQFLPGVHSQAVIAAKFHPENSHMLFSASMDGSVQHVDLNTQQGFMVYNFDGCACCSLDISTDELSAPLLMLAGEDETVIVTEVK